MRNRIHCLACLYGYNFSKVSTSMNQCLYQEDTEYPTVQSCEIPLFPPTFHMSTGEYTKSLPNGVHFGCFPPLALTP